MKSLFSKFMSLTLAILLLLAPQSAIACEGDGPAIWQAKGSKGTVYLLGSFHMLSSDVNWWSPTLGRLLMNADSLTMEVSQKDMNPKAIGLIVQTKGMYGGNVYLKDRVGDDTYARLMEQAQYLGIPELALDKYKPWYATLVISVKAAQVSGFLPEYGVEAVLTDAASQRGLVVGGLETPHDQLSRLADYDEKTQIDMLENTLDEIDEMGKIVMELKRAWCSGDEARLEGTMLKGFKEYPALYENLLVERNKNWIKPLTKLLNTPGHHLVAVGAAHLVGDDSVIRLLRDEGIEIKRAQ